MSKKQLLSDARVLNAPTKDINRILLHECEPEMIIGQVATVDVDIHVVMSCKSLARPRVPVAELSHKIMGFIVGEEPDKPQQRFPRVLRAISRPDHLLSRLSSFIITGDYC